MPATDPQPTLRSLLGRSDLGLRLASRSSDLPPDALDAPLRWVHSSDLADPTPFLADDLLLLTTGTQFVPDPRTRRAPTAAAPAAPAAAAAPVAPAAQ